MHAQLQKQLLDALGITSEDEWRGMLAAQSEASPEQAKLAQGLAVLLDSVDASYRQFDRAQELRLRSLSESATQLSAAQKQLQDERARQQALAESVAATASRLRAALRRTNAPVPAGDDVATVVSDAAKDADALAALVRDHEARFESLARVSSDYYWEQDAEFRFTLLSPGVFAVNGRQPSEMLGKTRWEGLAGDADDPLWRDHRATLEAHETFQDFEFKVDHPRRGIVYMSVSGEPVFDEAGEFKGYRGIARDVTSRVRADQQLREALQLTEALFESAPTAIALKNDELRFTHLNAEFEKLFEMPREQSIGKTARELRGDVLVPHEEDERKLLADPRTIRYEITRTLPSGAVVNCHVIKAPLFDANMRVRGIFAVYSDITELKRTQARLSEQLRMTDTLIDAAPMPISIKDARQRFTRINAAYEREFGVRREDIIGRTTLDAQVFGREDSGSHVEEELRVNPGVKTYTRSRAMPDGSHRHYITTKVALANLDGRVTGFMTMHADVTDLKNAEQRAEDQLRMTSILLDASPAPIMIKDAQRKITYVNTAYERLFGVRREDMQNIQMRPVHDGQTLNDIGGIEMELLRDPGIRQFEYALSATDGRRVDCAITKSTFNDPSGALAGIITSYSDITQLKRAERAAEEQLRLTNILLDASPTPLVVKNRALEITLVNTAYEQMFGVARGNILNQTSIQQRGAVAQEIERIERNLLEHPGVQQTERVLKVRDGRAMSCIVTKSTYSNQAGEVSGIITTFTDITDLKRTEENLIRAKQEAEAAMRTRSQFLANMSHEIRTPMNGVLGMTSLLSATELNAEQREFVDTIRVSGEGLLKIINDILDFSKIEAGKVEIENTPFDLRSRVAGVVQLFTASAREKELALSHDIALDVPRIVRGDPVRISQALSNLLGNAIKFTQHGMVRVGVTVPERDGDRMTLRFEVRDTGIGIAPEMLSRIFEPFSQADASTTRRFGGTGLGLTISRQLAEQMGGVMTVDSTPGEGSCFSFTIKVSEAAELEPPVERRAVVVERQGALFNEVLEVLLAEDNPVNQAVATAMLKKLGCNVTLAVNGREAVDAVRRQRFDLVMMDCHMPEMDGFAATAGIRELERAGLARNIIIAQTANAMEGDRESCLAAGMDDYISKPFSTEALAAIIGRWKKRT